jgi:hypothetical protein
VAYGPATAPLASPGGDNVTRKTHLGLLVTFEPLSVLNVTRDRGRPKRLTLRPPTKLRPRSPPTPRFVRQSRRYRVS